ncbi:hypothetical protein DL240_10835 [Lujinxingia litoralis]|uniref:Ribosomal subunit interface protein n=1 Tax=Lujinxingia litoralis TaxID=2211119 RepID=A0A328C5P6_9DELT|nr:HPF/RaiA family ribosome-associated protein [Lujinxingia litoralis]RAL22336.1 hypothetical protein DL240_10835 [Lujinxingia litoralis]
MNIQVNTDSSIQGDERLEEIVDTIVSNRIERFRHDVTRVEVHLRDENAQKGGADDKHCTMEARVEGLSPLAVSHNADELRAAITGAARKLEHALDSALGKRKEHR